MLLARSVNLLPVEALRRKRWYKDAAGLSFCNWKSLIHSLLRFNDDGAAEHWPEIEPETFDFVGHLYRQETTAWREK